MNGSFEPRWAEVTAAYGGTFDPPHLGHREAVQGLFENPGVARALVLPAAVPPQKPGRTPSEQRAEMVRLNFGGLPHPVSIDLREMRRAEEHPETPTYTFETLQELRREHARLAFVIGTDQLRNLPSWRRFPEVLSLCHWIVLERKPGGPEVSQQVISEWEGSGLLQKAGNCWRIRQSSTVLKVVPTPARALSSSQIRETIGRTGRPPENALLPDVVEYLKAHRIYGSE